MNTMNSGPRDPYMFEEDAFFDGEGTWYINGRQKAFHLIPRPMPGTAQ